MERRRTKNLEIEAENLDLGKSVYIFIYTLNNKYSYDVTPVLVIKYMESLH